MSLDLREVDIIFFLRESMQAHIANWGGAVGTEEEEERES